MVNFGHKRLWMLIGAIILGLLVIFFGGYWVFRGDRETVPTEMGPAETALPRMANLPPKKLTATPPPPAYPPDAPVLEQARKALRDGIDPAEALAKAKSLPESPERPDAVFLLLEYAADSGNAEAALAVGGFYDPTDDEPSGTIRKNAVTAYEWYQEALDGGQEEAKNRLAKLRQWVEEQAAQGSGEARELLKRWR